MTSITKMNVVKLNSAAKPAKKVAGKFAQQAALRQRAVAYAIGAVGVTLTGLSLNHLATGIGMITGAGPIESGMTASAIDLGFIVLEAAQIVVTAKTLAKIARFTGPTIIGLMAGSAAMNALAFASHATGNAMIAAAVALGVAIPALIYVLMRVGAALYIDGQTRSST